MKAMQLMDASDLVTDLTKPKVQRKKKRLMMPQKAIVPIRCADKIGAESWNDERAI
jgi:hypothetical protein